MWAASHVLVILGDRETSYLCNHHVTVKGTLSVGARGTLNVGADLGDNGGTKGHVGHEVAVHDVDLGRVSGIVSCSSLQSPHVQPVGALGDGVRACLAQLREVGG
jgi:hypothetical protein